MSRTDNTRPWEIQARDLTEKGDATHACMHFSISLESWQELFPTAKRYFHFNSYQAQDGRMYFSVTRLNGITAEKQTQQIYAIFGEAEIREGERWLADIILKCKDGMTCDRTLYYYGGERYLRGKVGTECNRRRRQIRQRERSAIRKVLTKEQDAEDFDIPPIRGDQRTVYFDLT